MKRKMFQKVICFILSVSTFLGIFGIGAQASSDRNTNSGTAASLDEMKELLGMSSYDVYASKFDSSWWSKTVSEVDVDVTKFYGDGYLVSDSNDCKDSKDNNPSNLEPMPETK